MLLYDWRSDEDSDMVLEGCEPDECSIVIVVWHLVADSLFCFGYGGSDDLSELCQLSSSLYWSARNVGFHNPFFAPFPLSRTRSHPQLASPLPTSKAQYRSPLRILTVPAILERHPELKVFKLQ